MKIELTRFVGVLIIFAFFGYFIYPTPYYYTHMFEGNSVIKINRFSGASYVLNPSLKEWSKLTK